MKRSFYEETITALFSKSELFCFFATLALLIDFANRVYSSDSKASQQDIVLVYTSSLPLHGTLQKSI